MNPSIKTSMLAGTVALGMLFASCDQPGSPATHAENHRQDQAKETYACPMHPEVTGQKGDTCSKCGMDLTAVPDEHSDPYQVTLTTAPSAVEAGATVRLTFTFGANGRNVPLEVSHEMKVHLIAVNEALTWFRHLHPEEQADGSYALSETFPQGGRYLLFTDYKPEGAAPVLDKKEITVKGNPGSKGDILDKFVSVVDGYTVTLENGNDFRTGRTQPLKISVSKEGKQLSGNDIEQYLGAAAHIVMIGKAGQDYLHIHPVSDRHFPIYAETHIEKQGIYRMWVQFSINGQVHTADFTVNVTGSEKTGVDEAPSQMHHH